MAIRIRKATAADSRGIARVHVDSWRSSYAGVVPSEVLSGLSYDDRQTMWDGILDSQTEDKHCYVAETSDDRIVGFACGGPVSEGCGTYEGEIYSIYLLEDYQRSGLGRQLLLSAARRLKDDGIESMLLWVFEENHGARRFYESLGGELIGRKKIRIGSADLVEVAYGWKDIRNLAG